MTATAEINGRSYTLQVEGPAGFEVLSVSFIPARNYADAQLVFEFRIGADARSAYGSPASMVEASVSLRSASGPIVHHGELVESCRPGHRCIAKLSIDELPDFDVVDVIGSFV